MEIQRAGRRKSGVTVQIELTTFGRVAAGFEMYPELQPGGSLRMPSHVLAGEK